MIESRFKPRHTGLQTSYSFSLCTPIEYKSVSISPLKNQIGFVDESDMYDCLNLCLNLFYNWEILIDICYLHSLSTVILVSYCLGKVTLKYIGTFRNLPFKNVGIWILSAFCYLAETCSSNKTWFLTGPFILQLKQFCFVLFSFMCIAYIL